MDMCYIDDQTKTVFVLTEYGFMAFNPKTADFDIVLEGKDATNMCGRARVVSPAAGMDYAMGRTNQKQQTKTVQSN